MEPQVRYCKTDDGGAIAWTIAGEGPAIVSCPFFVESLAIAQQVDAYRELMDGLSRGRTVVRYDMRGTGLSRGHAGRLTLEGLVADLEAVVQAAGLRQFALFGMGLSGPRAIAYAARHPEQVTDLLLYSTFARPADTISRESLEAFVALARANWPVAAQTLIDLSGRVENPSANAASARVFLESAGGELVADLLLQNFETSDVTALLPLVRAPTLVMHQRRTTLFTVEMARDLAAAISGARLALFDTTTSWIGEGAARDVVGAVDAFLGQPPMPAAAGDRPATGALRTVIFTDVVGHTGIMRRLGDARGREVLREHERVTRDTLGRYGGDEIKSMGDGFMTAFSSVALALQCAIALQRAMSAAPILRDAELSIRIGMNVGEPIAEDGDLFGASVILAARIAEVAQAGQILIPEPVRHLVAGKMFSFSDAGVHAFKGFEDPVQLYEVSWQNAPEP